ncbi:auxin-responsive protein SAUR71-like protein [Tanacetum coccineum]
MKKLTRRLSRVADSSEYSLVRTESHTKPATTRLWSSWRLTKPSAVPRGHIPVYVGEEMKRFVFNADLLKHPVIINLLNKSAQEYGYEHRRSQ